MKVHSDGMDTEQAFAEITKDIAEGRVEDVGKKVLDLIENDKTPYTLIKCMSLVKVIDDPETMKAVTTTLMNNLPEDDKVKIEVCGALRGLDHPMLAYSILKTMGDDDVILRLSAVCLVDLEEYESALEKIRSIREMQVNDRIVLTSILSSLGEHTDAVAIAVAERVHKDLVECAVIVIGAFTQLCNFRQRLLGQNRRSRFCDRNGGFR